MLSAKIVVLGGSSPFTAGLVEALRARGAASPPGALWLHGRDEAALEAMRRYGEARLAPLGWTARRTTALDEALEGAAFVVHQVRYGGLEGRAEGERLASAHGLPADETLGPAALLTAIRAAPALSALAEAARRACPDAWLLNLTNPLSVCTAVLARAGIRALGLCELPAMTFRRACARLGLDPAEAAFRYAGLNHRGFIVELSAGGRDRIPELARALGGGDLDGITAADIEETGAIPLKYFRLLRGGAPAAPGRADYLAGLRARLLEEIRRAPGEPPPSLSGRVMEWYPFAVVPFLEAAQAGDGRVEVVNAMAADGIVREARARVLRGGIEPLPDPPSGRAGAWIEAFAAQERAALAAALEPSRARIEAALAADPLVPAAAVSPLSEALAALATVDRARG